MIFRVKEADFTQQTVFGVECPVCGEWIIVDCISDIEDYICECMAVFTVEENK